MNRIKRLDEKLTQQIAAGEVVERPSMIIKELVENSIDAKATSIIVEVKNGGKSFIKVSDNGTGILRDDVLIAFERHATSKISDTSDLYNIKSRGFRGEALASISVVSRLSMITKTSLDEDGIKLTMVGGECIEQKVVSANIGTSIQVTDLFFNLPARKKFLSTDAAELKAVTELMQLFAISEPFISFTYIYDDSLAFSTSGDGLLPVVTQIFGHEFSENLRPIEHEQDYFQIRGLISTIGFTRPSKNRQYFFVNDRIVKNSVIQEAFNSAYSGKIFGGRFPVCIINLKVPEPFVDVNVHPAKTKIKFADDEIVQNFVFSAVRKCLTLFDQTQKVKINSNDTYFPKNMVKGENTVLTSTDTSHVISNFGGEVLSTSIGKSSSNHLFQKNHIQLSKGMQKSFDTSEPDSSSINSIPSVGYAQANKIISAKPTPSNSIPNAEPTLSNFIPSTEPTLSKSIPIVEPTLSNSIPSTEPTLSKENMYEIIQKNREDKYNLNEFEISYNQPYQGLSVIGVFAQSYILLQKDKKFYMIDQHAAHEKVLFEQIQRLWDSIEKQSQLLMMPLVYTTTFDTIEYARSVLEKFGFELTTEKNTLKITALPSGLGIKTCESIIESVISEQNITHDYEAIALKACKSAIKAGDSLTESEIEKLLNDLSKVQNPYTCPHGRPIMLEFDIKEIEKWFKRT